MTTTQVPSRQPAPGTPEWARLVTASKVPAIVGLSPWDSPYSMWHRMRGDLPDEPPTDAMLRGHLLEPAVLAWWETRHPDAYIEAAQPWLPLSKWGGATPDLLAADDGHGNRCVVEAKTAAHADEWGQPGTDEVPVHYAIQAHWQMLCAKVDVAYMPVLLGPGLTFCEYVIARDATVDAWLREECWRFWASLFEEEPPPVDDTPATLACLHRAHPDVDPDTSHTLTQADADELLASRSVRDAADARWRRAQSTVLAQAGTARWITDPTGQRIARRQPAPRGGIALHILKETTP